MSSSGFFTGRHGLRHLLLIGVVIAVVIVVIAAALFLFNRSSGATVTVTGAVAYLEQGHTSGGRNWFGSSTINYSSGFPLSVGVGGKFSITLNLANADTVSHTLFSFQPNAPFTVSSSSPAAPVQYPAFSDGATTVTLQVPSSAGTYALNLTVVCQ
ncbi:MAG TPA: hypothetical protein VGU43_07780 [Thermoplasmata archaeon]|nr:hypothetical protein [Thermoplasmata archaeon]